tara:strand:- start:978 stop:1676 length:699 start_codon:yes stop_codon:yes gene_type:complete
MNNTIENKDIECPACPECPELIDGEGNQCPECPDCNCQGNECPTINCPEVICPSVNDIVSGIFPGRNTGFTSSGRYFDVQANENYELMPDYDFYEPTQAFPSDSILTAPNSLLQGNVNIPPNQIANSQGFSLLNTSQVNRIDNRIDGDRMAMASQGEGTGPTTFGMGTSRTTGTAAERQVAAAQSEGGNVDQTTTQQTARDTQETSARDFLRDQWRNNPSTSSTSSTTSESP